MAKRNSDQHRAKMARKAELRTRPCGSYSGTIGPLSVPSYKRTGEVRAYERALADAVAFGGQRHRREREIARRLRQIEG